MAAKGKAPRINARRSIAELEAELMKRTAERDEALEQQTATAQVLQVINSSPGDLAPVFDVILEKAVRLCSAAYGNLLRYDGQLFSVTAAVHPDGQLAEQALSIDPFPPAPGGPLDRIVHGEEVNAAENIEESPGYRTRAEFREMADLSSYRSLLNVALRKEGVLLGVITIFRKEAGTFSERQIALLQNFASQAVIAMENARLITETREALEQQTATAEVLGVINASPGDLTPVFDAVLEKAVSLTEAVYGHLWRFDGEHFHPWRSHGDPQFARWFEHLGPIRPNPDGDGFLGRVVRGEKVLYIADVRDTEAYRTGYAPVAGLADVGGGRSVLTVALRKDHAVLGVLTVYRREVKQFSEKQISLLQSFAAQAVIAMENARLLTETREALEQQTATTEVLQVINSSPGDLAPVFDTMLNKAVQLCAAAHGSLRIFDGEAFHLAATDVGERFAVRAHRLGPIVPYYGHPMAPLTRGEPFVQLEDALDTAAYQSDAALRQRVDDARIRSWLAVALRKNEMLLGAILLHREEVRPFSSKEIALLQNFAAQAVIAMENARLLTETREALEQQTATAEVLQVINSSPGDLRPVFDAMLERAIRLCDAIEGVLWIIDGERGHLAASQGLPDEFVDLLRQYGGSGTNPALQRVMQGERVIHFLDMTEHELYRSGHPLGKAAVAAGVRTLVWVALVREGAPVGAFAIGRREVRSFTDKEIALLQNFAAQAVIAMENARLLGELRQRTDQVAELNRGLEARVAEQVEELGRIGRLKRFLAPQLAELIVSQGDEKILESHRREIVVVFCDLRGYTAFTETAEPEEVLDFLREYHGALGPLVSQFEGTLDQFSGDGIMVFFNDPVPCPDPAERAVKMAMAMREAAGKLIAAWRRHGSELGFGAGIAQGYATLGQIGFSDRSGYTAIGTVCNLAARLCAEAKDGQILVSSRIAEAVEAVARLEDLGNLELRGLRRPVAAFNVVQSTSAADARPNLTVVARGPGPD
jgi:GAF domain-containing protein